MTGSVESGALVASHLDALDATLDAVRGESARFASWGSELADRLRRGQRLLAAGNGGSAAEAQHLTAELVGRYRAEREPLSALALHADTSTLTALGNDYGYSEVFARQVRAHGRAGDVLLLLSTSGRSENLLAAAEAGRALGLTVWALTGPGPNPLADAAHDALCLPGATPSVQEAHLVAVHLLCETVDARLAPPAPPAHSGRPARRLVAGGPPVSGPLVVVGDALLDVDVVGQVDRLCPDAPAPVLDAVTESPRPGGAALTAVLATAGPRPVRLVAALGDDADSARLAALLEGSVEVVRIPAEGSAPVKTRMLAGGRPLLRLDRGGLAPGPAPDAALAAIAGAGAVLVSDYGRGVTADPAVRAALADAARRVPVVWDPHPRGSVPVPGAAMVTPNLAEAIEAAGSPTPPAADRVVAAEDAAAILRRRWGADAVAVTVGARGAVLRAASGTSVVPAEPAVGGDPCGAGDRFAAAAAVALAAGRVADEAVADAVSAAAVFVAGGGAGAVRRDASAPCGWTVPGDAPRAPERPAGDAEALVAAVRARGGRVVATGGCFDLLHAGHARTLAAARRLGGDDGALVVCLNSDASVRRLKGTTRPAVGQADRAELLAALACVDAVVVFEEDDPQAVLARLRPDVWVKGGDYAADDLPETPLVRSWGGRVVAVPYFAGRSSTRLVAATAAGRAGDTAAGRAGDTAASRATDPPDPVPQRGEPSP